MISEIEQKYTIEPIHRLNKIIDRDTETPYALLTFWEPIDDAMCVNMDIQKEIRSSYVPICHYTHQEVRPDGVMHYGIFDWVDGLTFNDVFPQYKVIRVLRLLCKACDALDDLHSRGVPIFHRNIKQDSFMVDENDRVYLTNTGLVYAVELTPQNRKNNLPIGTIGYAAPEVYIQGGDYDLRSDIYSFGILIASAFLPKTATLQDYILYNRVDLSKINMPTKIRRICKKATMEDPKKRYQTIKDLKKDLENAIK